MNKYALIKKSDLTQAMLNRSVSNKKDTLPVYRTKSYLLWIFPISTEFYIVEFDPYLAGETFDSYQWFNDEEIRDLVIANEASD